jgi:FkbM family methyltransferase
MSVGVVNQLPMPEFGDWWQMLKEKRRIPRTARRRARWRAMWQFDRVVAGLKPGDIAIDCGASGGGATHQLSANGATVYAFEPDPHGFAGLVPLFQGVKNVHLFQQAVGTEAKQIALNRTGDFLENPDHHVRSSSVFASKANRNSSSLMVEQIDLLDFIAKLPQPVTLLKMDIEGAEVPILERLFDTGLVRDIGYVFAETHERMIPELVKRTRALRQRRVREGLHHVSLDWV